MRAPELSFDTDDGHRSHPHHNQTNQQQHPPSLITSSSSSSVSTMSTSYQDELLVQFTHNVIQNWAERLESMVEEYLSQFEVNSDPQIIFIISFLLSAWSNKIEENEEIRKNRVNYVFNQLLLRTDGRTGNNDIFNRWLIYKLMEQFGIHLDQAKWTTVNLQITLRQEDISLGLLQLIESINAADRDQLSDVIKDIVRSNPWFGDLVVFNLKNYPFLRLRSNSDESNGSRRESNNFGGVIAQCLEEAVDRSDYLSIYKLINIVPDDQLNSNEISASLKKLILSILRSDYEIIDLDQFYAAIIGRATDKMAKLVSQIDWKLRIQGDLYSSSVDPRINSSMVEELSFVEIDESILDKEPIREEIDNEVSPILSKKEFKFGDTSDSTLQSYNEITEEKLINIILDHETKEWNVDNCFLLTTFEKKHFLVELLSAPLSHFQVIPDELKLLFLLEIVYNSSEDPSQPQVSHKLFTSLPSSHRYQAETKAQVSKAFIELRELVNSFWFNNLIDSKPFLSAVKAKLQWIFRCMDWCLKIRESLNYSEKLCFMFKILSQGASPLAIFNKFGILNEALESDTNDNDVNSEVLSLLAESGHQSELMIWYGYLAVKLTCLWIINNNSSEEEQIDQPNQISSLINKILPLSFRVEVLENLFSLLFLTQRDIHDYYVNDLFPEENNLELSVVSDASIHEISSMITSTSSLGGVSSASKKRPEVFIFPNNLIPDYLSLLKDCVLKAQASLFALKRRLNDSQNAVSETGLDDIFVESAIIGYDECKTRLRSLMDHINDSQWRYSVIEPAIVEQRLSTSIAGNNNPTNGPTTNSTHRHSALNISNNQTNHLEHGLNTNPNNNSRGIREESMIDDDESVSLIKGDFEEMAGKVEANNLVSDGINDLFPNANDKDEAKKEDAFSSLIPCMLASPDQLLRYCLIENQIDRAKQVYKLFKDSLVNTEEAHELLITEKTSELTSKCRNFLFPTKPLVLTKSPDSATPPRGIKVILIKKLLNEFLTTIGSETSGHVDGNRLLIDYSICSSASLELSEIILENCFQAKNLDHKCDYEEIMDDFINRTTSLLLLYRDSDAFRSLNLATLFSLYPDANLFTNPKTLISERNRILSIKRYLNDLRALLIADPVDPTTLSSPITDSRPLALQYQKLISCFPSGKFNYLKALFYHVRKVSEALNEARKRSENFARALVSADKVSTSPLAKQGTYFSVLYKSPSAILCSLVIKYGISPKVVDDLARDMKVDLLGTLCSVSCPQIPTTSANDDSSCDFTLVDSFHPALCELIQCYLTGSNSMENSVLIQNHFDDERASMEEGERTIIKNPELINYFQQKSWILVSLLKLLGLINIETEAVPERSESPSFPSASDMILDPQSPLQKWISLVRTTIGSYSKEDLISLTSLALHPRIPVHNSLVMRALEKCAINHDYIQIHRMLQLLDLKNPNSSLAALWTALLLKLTKETGDVKYALQMTCARPMRDLVIDLIFNSSSYSETMNAERALKSALSRVEKNPEQLDSPLILDTLHCALDTVVIYAKIGTLSGLKSWKDAYENLSEVDILTILKSKKCYSLAAAWNDTIKSLRSSLVLNRILSSTLQKAPSTDEEIDLETERLRFELLLLAFCEKSSKQPKQPNGSSDNSKSPSSFSTSKLLTEPKSCIASLGTIIAAIDSLNLGSAKLIEKVLPSVESWDSKELLVKHLLHESTIRTQPDKVDHYNNFLLGINLIKSLRPETRIHYEQLTVKPYLIVEQMLMNLEYEALEKVIRTQRLIKSDHLIEIYARKAVEVEIADNESVTGSETTLISSSILTEPSANQFNITSSSSSSASPVSNFKMPASVPSKEQWIPDHKVSICMLCRMEKFSMFTRKHHCRRCGRVVCGTCSTRYLLIPEISIRQLVRVCEDCHSQTRSDSSGSNRKESTSSTASSNGDLAIEWVLSPYEHDNETIRDEFFFESAPSSSLCLSLLKLHSDKRQCAKVIIEQLSRPLFEILSFNRVDYGLIINLIKSLLLSAKVLINDEESKLILEIDFLLSRVDIVKMLVEGNCPQRELIAHVISKEDASLRLQEKLIEMERFDLAYHIATKYGINLKQIWKTWAMVCLKHGQFAEARKKFKPCFGSKTANNMSDINSKLLQEIFGVFEMLKEKVNQTSLRERCKAIKCGQINALMRKFKASANPEEGSLPQVLIDEGLYYLEHYGSREDEIRFYVRFGLLRNAVQLFLAETNYGVFSNLFVTRLLLPCTQTGSFKKLLATFNSIDPTLSKSWKYWIHACKYLSMNNFYHILHAVQVFMGDFIRAAMTQITFFTLPRATDYSQLYPRLDHLNQAKQHCQDFLVNKGLVNKGCLAFSSQEVTNQIKVINLQIEITNKLFAKKTTLPSALVDISEEKETTNLKGPRKVALKPLSPSNNQLFVPTLLDDNINSKIQLAVLVLLELGFNISEGLEVAQQIINDHRLDARHVYRLAGKVLAQSNKVNLIQLINQLVDCIRLTHDPTESVEICDDLLATTISHTSEPALADQLIKLINNDLYKIDAYLLTEKLKSAYLLAVRLHRVPDVRRVLDACVRSKQDNLTRICQLWLDKNS